MLSFAYRSDGIPGRVLLANDNIVAVQNPSIDHAVALDTQGVCPRPVAGIYFWVILLLCVFILATVGHKCVVYLDSCNVKKILVLTVKSRGFVA